MTFDVGRAVREAKAGKVEFRVDKAGNIHTPVGKKSFSPEHLATNAMAVIDAVMRARPAAAKGTYLRSLTVSTTMGSFSLLRTSSSPSSWVWAPAGTLTAARWQ